MEARIRLLCLVMLAAFGIRLGLGLTLRNNTLATESYHLAMARQIASRQGSVDPRSDWTSTPLPASRTPLYHLLLAGMISAFGENQSLRVLQAMIGTLTVWVAFLLGREFFHPKAGLLCAVLTAVYPYYAFNDTGLTDRALYTLALSVAVLSSLRLFRAGAGKSAFLTGAAWGVAALVRSTGIVFLPFIAVWFMRCADWGSRRFRLMGGLALGFLAVLLPWIAWNAASTGRPLFVAQSGSHLWVAQAIMKQDCGYPEVSIDRCRDSAFARLAPEQREALQRYDDRTKDRFFRDSALDSVRRDPGGFLKTFGKKLRGAYSPIPNPRWDRNLNLRRGIMASALHAFSYSAIVAAALATLWRRRRDPEVWIAPYLFAGFTLCTLVFWSHTSHRAALDFILIVLASGNLDPAPSPSSTAP